LGFNVSQRERNGGEAVEYRREPLPANTPFDSRPMQLQARRRSRQPADGQPTTKQQHFHGAQAVDSVPQPEARHHVSPAASSAIDKRSQIITMTTV
jgi:hypothetical protein